MTVAAIILGLLLSGASLFAWLGWSSRKNKDRADAAENTLEAVRAAENAEAGVDRLPPDARRERLFGKYARAVSDRPADPGRPG